MRKLTSIMKKLSLHKKTPLREEAASDCRQTHIFSSINDKFVKSGDDWLNNQSVFTSKPKLLMIFGLRWSKRKGVSKSILGKGLCRHLDAAS